MTVVVYTKPNCGGCIGTKRHLDRVGIAYTEAPIDDVRDLALERGLAAVPIVAIDGQLEWGGYRPDRIDGLVA